MDWKATFKLEIQLAVDAREHGNEGQARVCARRAAGAVVKEYFQRRGLPVTNVSAYEIILDLLKEPGLPDAGYQAAEYLLMRVTKEFKLPIDVDLIEQARIIAECLLPTLDDV